jgi:3-deoxy-D-manno-octulosonic-acid transferase
MGGSLMRKGGQNILEPAVFSKPIIFGPHMFNFRDMAEAFLNEGAACRVNNKKELLETSSSLLRDSNKREELGSRANLLIAKNIGATQKNLKLVTSAILNTKLPPD